MGLFLERGDLMKKISVRNKLGILLSIATVVILAAIYYTAIVRYRMDIMLLFTVLAIVCMMGWMLAKISSFQSKKNEYMMSICQMWADEVHNDLK